MKPEAGEPLAERRARVAGEWRALDSAVGSETGIRLSTPAWAALIAGLVLGFTAARRLLGRSADAGR